MYYLAGKVSDVGVNFEMNVIRGDLVECLSTLLTAPKKSAKQKQKTRNIATS
jgi:hypothetical protein